MRDAFPDGTEQPNDEAKTLIYNTLRSQVFGLIIYGGLKRKIMIYLNTKEDYDVEQEVS